MMIQTRNNAWLLLLFGICLWQTGCCSKCGSPFCWDRCADIPAGAIPQPLGTYGCGWQNAQTTAAQRDMLTIYQAEWIGASTDLGPYGKRHMTDLPTLAMQLGEPIVVEMSENHELDQQRLTYIQEVLSKTDFPQPEQWVVLGYAKAEPMYGIEAEGVASTYLGGSQIRASNNSAIGY
ncbi:hypothetical protein DTL42_04850 [Bremerella cremea]|uniref:Uncharacterized protein n=1 Tax=Bremerella cremea TaxID=1031537 RepID=A0A368KVK6_9BACT|nr:hypothetical protein [Bremerella cremea]RCS54473.1 hypothetical protein DTL42_04850 [Bremerella cremea]